MAVSVVARAKIREAMKRGDSIPDTWATDRSGRPTTDPKSALDGFLQPIGGYKGYGLALIVDLFAGLLSGAGYLTHVQSWSGDPGKPQDLGHFFIVIDTTRLGTREWLADRMRDFSEIIHSTPRSDERTAVRLPGEIELDSLVRQRRDGIEVDDKLLAELERMARAP
jgi:LDH2 family malate/lactate/ureidoglycolate dehydrogenase